ncbi:yfeABCD locus regulator [Vibrio cholerae]|uniref:YniB family protein n=1 Tax=Vibrio cholerae TaxID=666 RepID=UPI000F3BF876|nr:YniB family protein [Vibrio cholerae]EGR2417030.1 yfeABCD locus regulator [Vibrio cholerae]MDV2311926.1 YniB family protein [Vibrio cholerae]NOE85466.1 yfeABCD locus regulator [Vibrio cholerae]NOE94629.1 yfeABCD locus regulator [Vibrio cholerae]NOF01490.1 yfeABCD locus regulator [Vibrio cholerae]
MNFYEAKRKSILYRVVGFTIVVPCAISTVISFLKMIYFRLDDGSKFGSTFAAPFKNLVALIYQKTEFLMFFWKNSPTPNHIHLAESDNIPFILIYLTIFVGLTFWGLGKQLSVRLKNIRKKIEDQMIEESVKGSVARTHSEIAETIFVPNSGMFSNIHKLYVAPIIVAVVGTILVKVLGF